MSVGATFSAGKNSVTRLYFVCSSLSDALLSDYPSAAICHMGTKCNGILVAEFNLYFHSTNIFLWCCGQHKKTEGITFKAAFVP